MYSPTVHVDVTLNIHTKTCLLFPYDIRYHVDISYSIALFILSNIDTTDPRACVFTCRGALDSIHLKNLDFSLKNN